MIITPALLLAHARLVKSTPAANANLTVVPKELTLWFSERPEPRFSKVELLDSAGKAVSLGAIGVVVGDAMALSVPIMTQPLANGRYTVAWRTAAADGHPSSGRYSFTLDAAAPVAAVITPPADTTRPATRLSNAPIDAPEQTAFNTTERWAELVAVLTLIGVVVFRLLVLRDAKLTGETFADASDRARRLGQAVIILFLVATVWRLAAQSALLPMAMSRHAAMRTVIHDTQWGSGWFVGFVGGIVVALALAFARATPVAWIVAALGAIAIAFGESYTGHSSALRSNMPLALATDVAHLLAAGGWLGGLTAVLLCGLPATGRLKDADSRDAGHRLVRAYHKAAVQCVVLVVITALIAAWLRLTSPSDLWTTTYGRVLVLKICLVLGLLAFGWFHWKKVVIPEWNDDTGFRFKRSGAFELLIGAAVIAATAVLVSSALPHS